VRLLGLCLSAALLASPCRGQCATPWIPSDPSALRAVVLLEGETDPVVARAIAAVGANAVASRNPPDPAAGANFAAAGLGYIAPLLVREVERLPLDTALLARLRSIPALIGIEYFDDTVTEGYATPDTQERAYGILKSLFPDLLILYATRLDPIATDPTFLDGYFRPEFSDLVVPYFYPVGITTLGSYQEGDPWEAPLGALLDPIAARMPAGKGVLPVLQAFEEDGFVLGGGFLLRQLDVYAELWPGNRNAAAFAWAAGRSPDTMDAHPVLLREASSLFGAVPSPPRPCTVSQRAAR
jgi:hypothetical protein